MLEFKKFRSSNHHFDTDEIAMVNIISMEDDKKTYIYFAAMIEDVDDIRNSVQLSLQNFLDDWCGEIECFSLMGQSYPEKLKTYDHQEELWIK